MKLHWSPRSPYVRKVMIAAHEVGVVDKMTLQRTVVSMTAPNEALFKDNPLGKIPTLVLADGTSLYDSLVICEYLESVGHNDHRLFPTQGAKRWAALQLHALADGALDILILWRNELLRAEASRSSAILGGFEKKIAAALAQLQNQLAGESEDFNIGHLTATCCLAYLDFRFSDLAWRGKAPLLAAWYERIRRRPSVIATEIVDDTPAQSKSA